MVYDRTMLAQRTFETHVSRGGGSALGDGIWTHTQFPYLAPRLIVNQLGHKELESPSLLTMTYQPLPDVVPFGGRSSYEE